MGFSRLLINYAVAVAVMATAVVAMHLVASPKGLHLTEAMMLAEETFGYQPPPETWTPETESGAWLPVALPNAEIPALKPTQTQAADPAEMATQITWYHVVLPRPVLPSEQEYLFIPRWKSDGDLAIYVNGRLQHQSHGNLQWNGSNRPLRIAFDNTAGAEPIRDIAIRLQHVRGIGGALSSLWVGSFDEVGYAYMVRAFFQAELPYLSSAVFIASGIFALFVWFGRRQERLYLLFFGMSIATFLRSMHNHMGLDRTPISDVWFGWLTVNSLMWMIAISHLFLVAIHQRSVPLITWMVGLATLLIGIITFPLLGGALDPTLTSPVIYIAMFVMVNVVGLAGLHAGWRAESLEALSLSGWLLATAYLGVYDLLLQSNVVDIEGYFMVPYVQIAVVIAFFHTIVGRYIRAMGDVEQSNLVLAERLSAREAELVASHDRLREIEQRELLSTERQRLMEDMHDGLGASLVGAMRMVERGKLDETEITQILQSCIDDLKLTIDSMESVETDLLLLLGTLRFRLQPRLESSGIKLRWEVEDVPPLTWLDHRHALHILRILQETFTNIIKHSDATEATVTTRTLAPDVVISVVDNGGGFDTAARGTGRGLANQLRRANAIGARVEIASSASGTQFNLILPIDQWVTKPDHAAVS